MSWIEFISELLPELMKQNGIWTEFFKNLVAISLIIYIISPLLIFILVCSFIGAIKSNCKNKKEDKNNVSNNI